MAYYVYLSVRPRVALVIVHPGTALSALRFVPQTRPRAYIDTRMQGNTDDYNVNGRVCR